MEPIAIVGVGCRVPGANNVQEFFNNNDRQVCSLRPLPKDLAESYDATRPKPGCIYTEIGGFIEFPDPSSFCDFYRVSPMAFLGTNRIQHTMLSIASETLRSAGLNLLSEETRSLRVIASNPYVEETVYTDMFERDLSCDLEARHGINLSRKAQGSVRKEAAFYQRVAGNVCVLNQFLRLTKGPIFVDGACASGLTAVSLAMEWLRQGRDQMVLAGAVCESREFVYNFLCSGAATGTVRSVPFDHRADGVIPGTGGALFLMMRLSDAEKAGKKIYAVLRNYGMSNNDSGHVWSSNRNAEKLAIERCFQDLDLTYDDIDYVEAHGTSTPLGDEEEYHALAATYGKRKTRALRVASVKSMIGHLLPAAGAVSILRAIYGFDRKIFPTTVNIEQPRYESNAWFHHQTSIEKWNTASVRRAGIDSFGFGGINYHVVLEEYNREQKAIAAPRVTVGDDAPVVSLVAYYAELPLDQDLMVALHPELQALLQYPFVMNQGVLFKGVDLRHAIGDYKIPPKQLEKFNSPKPVKMLDGFISFIKKYPHLTQSPERTGIIGVADFESFVELVAANRVRRKVMLSSLEETKKQAVLSDIEKYSFNEVSSISSELSSCVSRLALMTGINGFTHMIDGGGHAGATALQVAQTYIQSGRVDTVLIAGVEIADYLQSAYCKIFGKNGDFLTDSVVFLALKNRKKAVEDGDVILADLESVDERYECTQLLPEDGVANTTHFGSAGINAHLLELGYALGKNKKAFSVETRDGPILSSTRLVRQYTEVQRDESRLLDTLLDTMEVEGVRYTYVKTPINRDKPHVMEHIRTLSSKVLSKQQIYQHPKTPGKLCFLFPGGGSQFSGCLRELVRLFPSLSVFLDTVDSHLRDLRYPSVAELLWQAQSAEHLSADIERMQLAITIMNLAYYDLLTKELGVMPDMILGHSFGEYSALAASGVIGLKDALVLSVERGRCLKVNQGSLIYVTCASNDFRLSDVLEKQAGLVVIANVNSPKQVILSAENTMLDRCMEDLKQAGLACGRLDIPAPNHTGLNWRAAKTFFERMEKLQITPAKAKIPVFSNVLNDFYPDSLTPNILYSLLSHHMVVGVNFIRLLDRAYAAGAGVFIECGGKKAFSRCAEENLGDRISVCHVAHPNEGAYASLLRANAFLHANQKTNRLLGSDDVPEKTSPDKFGYYVPILEPIDLTGQEVYEGGVDVVSSGSDSVADRLKMEFQCYSLLKASATVLLVGLDRGIPYEELMTSYEEVYARELEPVVRRLQIVAQRMQEEPDHRLIIVTNTADDLDVETYVARPDKILYTALSGIARSLANEYVSSDIRLVDFSHHLSPEDIVQKIKMELGEERSSHPHVVWKQNKRYRIALSAR